MSHEEKLKKASISDLKKEIAGKDKGTVNVFGKEMSVGDVAEIIQKKRTQEYDIEKKKSNRDRGQKVARLASQMRKLGINIKEEDPKPADFTRFLDKGGIELLRKKMGSAKTPQKKSTFKSLLSRISSVIGRGVDSASGLKNKIKGVLSRKKDEEKKKGTAKMVSPPVGAKTAAAKVNEKKREARMAKMAKR